MPSYKAPVDDTLFLLSDVLNFERYGNLAGFGDLSFDVLEQIFGEAAKLCEEVLQPLNRVGDVEGCMRHDDASVSAPRGFKAAYDAFASGGWIGLSVPPEYDGQGLPYTLTAVINEFASAANMAFAMYPGLTQGALAALLLHGGDEQKRLYMPKMAAGRWTGTMNLTEPQCGTDLGLLTTKATPQRRRQLRHLRPENLHFRRRTRSAENIVHLVLARIEGAPVGVKGISLFIAPKFDVAPDGSLGERNKVACGSIEHKMGIHGNSTCVMNFDGAKGYLVGEPNRGLNAMFVMMNEARLGVAIQGSGALGSRLSERRRLCEGASPGPIAVGAEGRPIGRRTRSSSIPTFGACCWRSRRSTKRRAASCSLPRSTATSPIAPKTRRERQAAEDRLGLLTPVLKGVFTDMAFDNTVKAQQVFGGHGYIAEWGMEQFVRDARITMIYEGANGIQALDLVGRKLPKNGGRAIMAYFKEANEFVAAHSSNEAMKPLCRALKAGAGRFAKGHDVADAERHGQARQRRRGLERLHASVRARRARADVGEDRQGGVGEEGARARKRSAHGREAADGALLHAADAARNEVCVSRASSPAPTR